MTNIIRIRKLNVKSSDFEIIENINDVLEVIDARLQHVTALSIGIIHRSEAQQLQMSMELLTLIAEILELTANLDKMAKKLVKNRKKYDKEIKNWTKKLRKSINDAIEITTNFENWSGDVCGRRVEMIQKIREVVVALREITKSINGKP